MSRPKYPMPDHDWEATMFRLIDSKYNDDESNEACECVEVIRNERAALIKMLEDKPKRRRTKK